MYATSKEHIIRSLSPFIMAAILKIWLSNPFVLLVIGALISGLLIPSITTEWQNRQKELEIKTELVGKISEAVMSMVMPVQRVELKLYHDRLGNENNLTKIQNDTKAKADIDRSFGEVNDQFSKWMVSSATIGSQLKAYYPNTPIPSKWNSFSENVSRFYSNIQADYSFTFNGLPTDREDWVKTRSNILEQRDNIIQTILDCNTRLTNSIWNNADCK